MDGQRAVTYSLREAQGLLEPLPEVELVGSCRELIHEALQAAHGRGEDSLSAADLVDLGQKAGRSRKTVLNTLSAMTAGHHPNVIRPRGKRGRYALGTGHQSHNASQESQQKDSSLNRESLYRGVQNDLSGTNPERSQSTTGVSLVPDEFPTPSSRREQAAEIHSAAVDLSEASRVPDEFPMSSHREFPPVPEVPGRELANSPKPIATTGDYPLVPDHGGRDVAPAPARALYIDHSAPDPLDYDPEAQFPF